jgi:hypothetical protein
MMALKEYARHRGVSPPAVRKALETGRIQGEKLPNGGWRIDANKADQDWQRNTSIIDRNKEGTSKEQRATGGEPTRPVAALVSPEKPKEAAVFRGPATWAQGDDGAPDDEITKENALERLNIATAREKEAKALLAEMDYRTKSGELLERARVRADTYAITRQVRDSMMNIPDRIASDLAAETDAFEVHRKLTAEIRTALATLAEVIAAQADDGAAGA